MLSSLWSLDDNLSNELYNDKCKKYKPYLDFISIKDDTLLIFKFIDCNKNYEKEFDKKLTKKFKDIWNL